MQCACACVHVYVRGLHALEDLLGVDFRPCTRPQRADAPAFAHPLILTHVRAHIFNDTAASTRRCVRASFPVITPPLGVCCTRLSWDATSSGSESKSWQYRSWRLGCARRNEMCAFVEILAVTKYWRKQVETRQNRRYITVPAEHKSASCWFRRAWSVS